jgi:hypothetical protein
MCLVGCLAIFFPRLAVALVWLLGGDYLARAVHPWVWLLLGFFFMPTTVLAFAYAYNSMGVPGQVSPLGWLLVVIAGAVDIGLIGGGAHSRRKREKRDD